MHLLSQSVGTLGSLPEVDRIGTVVRSLSETGAIGTVLVSFDRSAYLQFDAQFLCVGLSELGASPITALFSSHVRKLPIGFRAGVTAQLSKHGLLLDDRYFFSLTEARIYESAAFDKSSSAITPMLQLELLTNLDMPKAGLGAALRQIISPKTSTPIIQDSSSNATDSLSCNTKFVSIALPAIKQLTDQLVLNCAREREGNLPCIFEQQLFQKLIGAGPGLTPSGDDFICGVFASLHLSGMLHVAESFWNSISPIAAMSTTPISYALMEQSSQGESSERHDAIIKAYFGYPATPIDQIQALVSQIGETSGWDWLLGFVLCERIHWESVPRFPAIQHYQDCLEPVQLQ